MSNPKCFILFILSFFVLIGCNPTAKNTPEGDTNIGSSNEDIEQIEKDITIDDDDVNASYYLFPAPGEILRIIDDEKLGFNEDLLNPVKNIDNYLDSKSQTLHLGVYLSDLAYIALFSMHDKALEYLNGIHKLSNQANVQINNINPDHIDKLLSSKEFKDSLLNLSNNSFFEMINYMESNGREDAVSMFSVGAFLESIYIAVNLVETYDPNNKIVKRISQQKAALINLKSYAEENKEKDNTKYYGIKEIREIKAIFDKCEFDSGPDETDTQHMIIKEADFYTLKKEITALRNKIIEG